MNVEGAVSAEGEARSWGHPAEENHALEARRQMGIMLEKSSQICERPESDINELSFFQLCCQSITRGRSTAKIGP
ncbi:MAG TPA: hypothetical protein VF626_06050 [Chthoniobacterales bacterium]